MLLRAIFENFLSFREPVQFDMFPNPKRTTHESHVYPGSVPVLKMAAVYGANGSGKSNLVRGLRFIHDFVSDIDFFKKNDIAAYIHKGGDTSYPDQLSALVEFESKSQYFIYLFSLSNERVISEALYISGLGNAENTLIFKRELDKLQLGTPVDAKVQEAIDKLLEKNPSASVIKLNDNFPIISDDNMQIAASWLLNSLVIVPFNAVAINLIEQLDNHPRLLGFAREVLSKIGLGVSDIGIKEEPLESWIKNKSHQSYSTISSELENDKVLGVTLDNRQMFIAKIIGDKPIVKEFSFKHTGSKGKVFELDITGESDGTMQLLNLIPAFYGAIESDQTIVIDEIDHSVHPTLIFALVKFFADYATKGQLIFTTHETCLLNQKLLMRPDEVWFAEKTDGASRLYSLNDFKEHNTISVENGYISGRYGAIPFIGNIEWLQ